MIGFATIDDAVLGLIDSASYVPTLTGVLVHDLETLHRSMPSVWPAATHAEAAIGRLIEAGQVYRDSDGLICRVRQPDSRQPSLF